MKFKLPIVNNEGIAAWLAMVDAVEQVPDEVPAHAATTIIDGVLTLYLSSKWPEWSEDVQREVLSHECHHVVFDHHARRCQIQHDHTHPGDQRCERDNQLWGLCIDAVLHHNCMSANYNLIDEATQGKSVTFERIGISPCRAEIAYDRLLKNESPNVKVVSCGSAMFSQADGTQATQDLIDKMMVEVGPHLDQGGTHSGPPMAITGTIPAPPPWIQKVIPFLIESVNRANKGRSWRRFSRTGLDMLPGREMVSQLDAQIFIDQSGSCDQHVALFLAAVCSTPELAGTRVYSFDDKLRGPIPASDMAGVRKMLEESRGGTLIKAAGRARESGCPVVWLTDAESGDGLPKIHDAAEVWCVVGGAQVPGGRHVIRVEG